MLLINRVYWPVFKALVIDLLTHMQISPGREGAELKQIGGD